MGVRSEGNGHRDVWKLLIGLSVVCAVLVFVGGFLHRRALDSAITDRQAKSVALVNTKVADAAKHTDLDKPLKDPAAAHLTKQLDLPSGTDLRLFSAAGGVLYSSPGLSSFPADAEGLQSAASGDPAHVVDDADLRVYVPVEGKGAKPVAIAAVVSNYTQLRDDAAGPLDGVRLPIVALGVVLLVAGLLLMLQATKGAAGEKAPAAAPEPSASKAKSPSSGKTKSQGSGKRRVTGFDPVPVTIGPAIQRVGVEEEPKDVVTTAPAEGAASETGDPPQATSPAAKTVFGLRLGPKKPKQPAVGSAETAAESEPAAPKAKRSLLARKGAAAEPVEAAEVPADKAASALEREIAIRQALEDQLEQSRTRMQMQDVETANTKKELLAQLEAANARAEEAEARARDAGAGLVPATAPQATAPVPAPVPDETAMHVQQLEREVSEARAVSTDAVAQADALQRQLDEAKAVPAADAAAAAKLAEATAQLADAQQRASAAEQRAASVESVREELEVRVAQLGTKASELEQRATELETSLNEANAGGDAVRAEIATLTAALAAANARVTELESAPAPAVARNDDDQAEIARLRGELANHMERAQVAEDRVATLEADRAAAEHDASTPQVATNAEPWTNGAVPEPTTELELLASRLETSDAVEPEPESVATQEAGPVASASAAPRGSEGREPEIGSSKVVTPEVRRSDPEPETSVEMVAAAQDEPSAESATSSSEEADVVESMNGSGSITSDASPLAEGDASEREPAVAAEAGAPDPAVETTQAEPDRAEPAPPAVEWHAPVSTPGPSRPSPQPAASSNGGIPPAPSSDARYDDMWTAAFAAPEPEPELEREPEPEPAPQPPEATASPDDQPSPPEDELSAEDDMWSLRARLEAASRKHDVD